MENKNVNIGNQSYINYTHRKNEVILMKIVIVDYLKIYEN